MGPFCWEYRVFNAFERSAGLEHVNGTTFLFLFIYTLFIEVDTFSFASSSTLWPSVKHRIYTQQKS